MLNIVKKQLPWKLLRLNALRDGVGDVEGDVDDADNINDGDGEVCMH